MILYMIFADFYSWNVFLLISAVPSLLAALVMKFMPESPKFLMTVGKNEKALKVLRKVYSINTGKPPNTFPVSK